MYVVGLHVEDTAMDGFAAPSATEMFEWTLRFLHVLFGIAWIGMLYFFNLVNVPVMAKLDGPTKGKVIPVLMPKALWVFRWGAVGTWVLGFIYYAYYCSIYRIGHAYLGAFLVVTLLFYAVMFLALSPKAKLLQKSGVALGVVIAALSLVYFVAVRALNHAFTPDGGALNGHVLFIGYGGGLGTFMLFNVWGIIWRNQKRIIAWTAANAETGAAIPPESPVLGRQAFLASRTNAWLSLPMLAFMILAGHGRPLMP
jgi:uncharacterized membrane protein